MVTLSKVVNEPIDQNGNITKESSTETDKKVDANKESDHSLIFLLGHYLDNDDDCDDDSGDDDDKEDSKG